MTLNKYQFTVDARLLRELGERLVGRPHIALAELIKNSYDADARLVELSFDTKNITVTDDGHGMSIKDFTRKWMRVGSTHKETSRTSPRLDRTVTGSKGVGRLAVQVLARETQITSVALTDPTRITSDNAEPLEQEVDALINWDDAVRSGDLTAVTVPVETRPPSTLFAGGSRHGTRVALSNLVHAWDSESFERLAQEIWSLQPPFEINPNDLNAFRIVLTTDLNRAYDRFSRQMSAVLEIWDARITGRLLSIEERAEDTNVVGELPTRLPDRGADEIRRIEESPAGPVKPGLQLPTRLLKVRIQLKDGPTRDVVWKVPHCELDALEFDIRVFDLRYRQPRNIKVGEAREYLRRFGGIAIYDGGFRLPYYGAEQDWLYIERDHAARLSTSRLLPDDLNVERGMQDLPTNRRLFGKVAVSTSHEAEVHRRNNLPSTNVLAVQVTRDRLVDNGAYEHLRVMVRASLDAYAMERARTRLTKARRKSPSGTRPPSATFEEIRSTLSRAADTLPAATYRDLSRAVTSAIEQAQSIEEVSREHAALLGALATAGITSIAYEHEMSKQIATIRELAGDLEQLASEVPPSFSSRLKSMASEMRDWIDRAAGIRNLLAPLMDEETRTARERFKARTVASQVARQIRALSRGVPISVSAIPAHLLLPRASYPAWAAVFQNLYVNAFNALMEIEHPQVDVDGGGDEHNGWIRVQDNGVGVDLSDSERLWEPFERESKLSPDVAALGLGGTGLGLTIVRMIADEVGVRVKFTVPDKHYRTAVTISWKDPK